MLIVGESPLANGTFFYKGDSNLYKSMKDVFRGLWDFDSDEEFLEKFKHEGFYLEDLCDEPINHLPSKIRETKRSENVENMADKIRELKPEAVIVVMNGIQRHVERALDLVGVKAKHHSVPFPIGAYKKHSRGN